MKKEIQLHKRKVEYTLSRSKRAQRMRLAIYCDGAFVVTAPHTMSESLIERFIIKKSQWILDKFDYFKRLSNVIVSKSTQKDFIENRDQALLLATKRVEHFNKIYQFKFNIINIKNQKTRWGSCSKKGNLNFNYKIVFLPQRLVDYIIVHELAHLGEFNHSQKFWNLVAKALPDYSEVQNELKESGLRFQ